MFRVYPRLFPLDVNERIPISEIVEALTSGRFAMPHPIKAKIEQEKAAIADELEQIRALEQSVAIRSAKLAAYEEVFQFIDEPPIICPVTTAVPLPPKMPRKNDASAQWLEILKAAALHDNGTVTYEVLNTYAAAHGKNVSSGNTRVVMMNNVEAGIFSRLQKGVFQLTQKGAEVLGVPMPPQKNFTLLSEEVTS